MKEVGEQWRMIADSNLDLYMHTHMHACAPTCKNAYIHTCTPSLRDAHEKWGENYLERKKEAPVHIFVFARGTIILYNPLIHKQFLSKCVSVWSAVCTAAG